MEEKMEKSFEDFLAGLTEEDFSSVGDGEYVIDDELSVEGSKGNRHFEEYEDWNFDLPPNVVFKIRKSKEYIRGAKKLNLYPKEFEKYEIPVLAHIVDSLKHKKFHKPIYNIDGVRLSECDFRGRDYGRLIYCADHNPPCVYLGFVFKRDDNSIPNGSISEGFAREIARSIVAAKEELIREEKENARRNNRGK
jgi:hypothetical protein